jgi:hypothetical protein
MVGTTPRRAEELLGRAQPLEQSSSDEASARPRPAGRTLEQGAHELAALRDRPVVQPGLARPIQQMSSADLDLEQPQAA